MAYNDTLTATEINTRILQNQNEKLDFLLKLYFENDNTHKIANGIQENTDQMSRLETMVYAEAQRSNLLHPHELPALKALLIGRDGHLKRIANGYALTEIGNEFWKAGTGGYVKRSSTQFKKGVLELIRIWAPVALSVISITLSIIATVKAFNDTRRLNSLEKRIEQLEK